MKLYMVQHAEPLSKHEDSTRPLSSNGRRTIQKVARYASRHLQIQVDQVIHSGKLRAQQTAEILSTYLTPADGIMADSNLEPLADPQIIKERLAKTTKHIMLVGHLPHLGKLASLLLVGDKDKEVLTFKMAGIACLYCHQQSHWTIQWVITPETIP